MSFSSWFRKKTPVVQTAEDYLIGEQIFPISGLDEVKRNVRRRRTPVDIDEAEVESLLVAARSVV